MYYVLYYYLLYYYYYIYEISIFTICAVLKYRLSTDHNTFRPHRKRSLSLVPSHPGLDLLLK